MRGSLSRTVATPEVELEYLECGNPDGTPVFLLHGFPDAPVGWNRVIDHLPKKRLRLIAPFVRGYGNSTVRREDHVAGQLAALVTDLFTLADALGIEHFHLVGHDWGARTAYAAAVLSPSRVRSITTLATAYVMDEGKPESPEQAQAYWYQWYFNSDHGARIFASNPDRFCEHLWRAWSPTWQFSHKEFAETARAFQNPQFVPIVLHSYRQRWKGAPGLRVYNTIEAALEAKPPIDVPATFIHGAADACNLPSSVKGQDAWFRAGYTPAGLRDVGHFPHREEPRGVARAITRQLEKAGAFRSR